MQRLLQKIQRSSLKLLTPLNSQELFKICVEEATVLAGGDEGSLFLEKNDSFVRVYSSIPLKDRIKPHPRGNMYKAFIEGKTKFIPIKTIRKTHPEATNQFESMILVPLTHHTKRLGVLSVHCRKKIKYNAQLRQTLEIFGSLCALAIRNLQLYENAKAAVKTRELFMSAAAHELKTPLTTIQVYSQLVQKNAQKEQPIKEEWVTSILSNTKKLQMLIAELFNVSQMKMGVFSYSFAPKDLLEIVTKVVEDHKLMHKRIIKFTYVKKLNYVIDADKDKLELVVSNILGNAIKYSKAPTPVEVSLRKKNQYFIIDVKDYGKGIDAEDVEHMFKPFFRGKGQTVSGLGLGLHLCKEIIDAHHGEIKVSSVVNKGTKVSIFLPLNSDE